MSKSAVDAPRGNTFLVDPNTLTIITDPTHPLFDNDPNREVIDEAMVKNIMTLGVKEIILVRKENDKLVVVNGRRRTRHAIEANKRLDKEGSELIKVNVKIEKGDDAAVAETMIATNRFREDDGPLASARKAQKLLGLGRTNAQVAIAMGVTTTAVRQWLQLLELDPKVQKAVDAGAVSASAAAELHGLERSAQVEALDKLVTEGAKVTAKTVKKAAAEKSGRDHVERPSMSQLRELYEGRAGTEENAEPVLSLEEMNILGWILGDKKPTLAIQGAIKLAYRTREEIKSLEKEAKIAEKAAQKQETKASKKKTEKG